MTAFRYRTDGAWFKGNTHIHSTLSDGGRTFAELAELYASAGYHFLARTDHWVASDVKADRARYPLLWLDGIELDGLDDARTPYHVACLGTFKGLKPEMGLVAALEAARAQGGLLILAHPFWCDNSLDAARRWGFHGVEIYNHVCRWLNGKAESLVHWNAMLPRAPNTLAFAADDAHVSQAHPGWNGGWIVVNAPEGTRAGLLAAIRAGNFYSSCGPEIHALELHGSSLVVRTSPVQFLRLAGRGWENKPLGSFGRDRITEARIELPADWEYIYLEIEDDRGRRAWTNTLFTEQPAK